MASPRTLSSLLLYVQAGLCKEAVMNAMEPPNWFAKVAIQLRSSGCERPTEAEGIVSLCPQARQLLELTVLALLALQTVPVFLAQLSGTPPFPLPVLGFPLLIIRKVVYGKGVGRSREGKSRVSTGSLATETTVIGQRGVAGPCEQDPQEQPSSHLLGRPCSQRGPGPHHFHRSQRRGNSGE